MRVGDVVSAVEAPKGAGYVGWIIGHYNTTTDASSDSDEDDRNSRTSCSVPCLVGGLSKDVVEERLTTACLDTTSMKGNATATANATTNASSSNANHGNVQQPVTYTIQYTVESLLSKKIAE